MDCYWAGEVEDEPARHAGRRKARNTKRSDSGGRKNYFGSLRLFPFPFTGIFRYDDPLPGQQGYPDYLVLCSAPVVNGIRRVVPEAQEQMHRFVDENVHDIMADARELRMQLRSLDGQKIMVEVIDKESRRNLKIPATFTIKYAAPHIPSDLWRNELTKEVLSLAPGFDYMLRTVQTKSSQGHCVNFMCGDPNTGVPPDLFEDADAKRNLEGEEAANDKTGPQILTKGAIGAFDHFDPTDKGLHRIVNNEHNFELASQWRQYHEELTHSFRKSVANEFAYKKRVLSYHFWVRIEFSIEHSVIQCSNVHTIMTCSDVQHMTTFT